MLNPPFKPKFVRCGRWQGVVARGDTLYYPIWLCYAAGVLEQRNEDVRLVDAPAWGWGKVDVVKDAKEFGPRLIVVDSNFSSLRNDIYVAKLLKDNFENVKTVLVGPPTSQFADQILQNDGVDIVARFEYDFTIRDIAETIEEKKDFRKIKGVSYKENGMIFHNPNREFIGTEDLDKIPFVSKVYKEHLDVKDYSLDHTLYPEVQIITARGCPNTCTFCSWPETLMGRQYRPRSIENVIDELEYVQEELPEVEEVFIEDDTFTINRKRVIEFTNEIQRRKLDITWSCNARANLDYRTLRVMKKAGCRLLDVGYESGSDEILKNIKKGITTSQMRKFTEDSKRAGLMILGDFVFGFPGETRETAEKTIKFAKELRPNMAQFVVATPIPGTEFYRWTKENDFLLADDLEDSLDGEGFQRCIVSYPEFSDKDVEIYVDKALKEYYFNLSYISIAMKNVLRKNGFSELKRMMMSAKVFFKYMKRGHSAK